MSVKRILIIAAILLPFLAVFFFGLRQGNDFGDEERVPVKSSLKVDSLEFSLEIPKTKFKSKERVPIALRVKNLGNSPVGLFFTSGQKFDIFIQDASGREIWRWSKDKAFTMALEEIELKPGGEKIFSAEWPQVDSTGKIVSPGDYLVLVKCMAKGFEDVLQGTIKIE